MPLPEKAVTIARNELPVLFVDATTAAKTVYLALNDTVVRVAASATFDATIYLPHVSEAKGMSYSILATDADTGDVVTIADLSDSENWSNLTLNATNEGVVLYSDGRKWWTIASTIS